MRDWWHFTQNDVSVPESPPWHFRQLSVPFLFTDEPCTLIHGTVNDEPMWWQLLHSSRHVWQRLQFAGLFLLDTWFFLNSSGCGSSWRWQSLQNFAWMPPAP